MGGSVNKVILVGALGKDPEIRTLNNGDRVANLSVATSEVWRDKASGEKKEKTEWHRITVFNDNLTKVCENYLKKGSPVYLEGKLQTRKYEQKGVEKYATEVVLDRFGGVLVMLGGKDKQSSSESFSGGGQDRVSGGDRDGGRQESGRSGNRPEYDLNDDIPF